MKIVLHTATHVSSATPVEQALLELDLDHELRRHDLSSQAHRKALADLNPNFHVPTLEMDGTPVFEALAIQLELGERFGAERGLWPAADSTERLEAVTWLAWTYTGLLPGVQYMNLAGGQVEAMAHPPIAEHGRRLVRTKLEVLEGRLEGRSYVVGEQFSLVDVALSSLLGWARYVGVSLDGLPRVADYFERCAARPAFQKSFAIAKEC